jgi:hypothetical protein
MSDTYTWGIANLERHLSDGAVYTAHWTLSAERVFGGEIISTGSYGSIGFSDPDPDTFTPYDQLTLPQVITWVQNTLDTEKVAEMEAALSNQLDQLVTPTDASGTPW